MQKLLERFPQAKFSMKLAESAYFLFFLSTIMEWLKTLILELMYLTLNPSCAKYLLCVTLNKVSNLFGPQFLHLKSEANSNIYLIRM